MRSTWINSLMTVGAAAPLVAGITVASAQGPGGMGGRNGGGQQMHQAPAGGGFSGGGHGPSMGMQGGPGGHVGGFSQSRGPSFGGGALHTQRGPGFATEHTMRSERMTPRGRTGIQNGALSGERGRMLGEQRGSRGQALAQQHRLQGQNLRTTRSTRQTGVNRTERGTRGFAQAGTRSRISLDGQQRTRIQHVVLQRGFISRFRVTHVNFDVAIGVRVPRHFHLFVVPEDIVFIAPAFRHFLCFVYDDELVIVDPFTFEIVAIIPV